MEENKNEMVITRIFNTPRELLWKYWTDSEFFKRWWGPDGFTCPFSRIDFRVGGSYLHAMRSPEGKDYWSTGTYKEISPPEKIVATDSFADEKGNVVSSEYYGLKGFPMELVVSLTFKDLGEKTKLTLVHRGIGTVDEKTRRDMKEGWNQSFNKLTKNLSSGI
ncbi:MAG: SRPBCC domain-containing protein [Syntrophales bacterium]|jgi:uncharacterized protein YndB with AHSA1/START domain|nr:SRPBCC domain-containing protein [Syntrophales bacterium]MDY0043820.1 SRPBCC domain-containing protein [Syntrophales bacterium]